MPYEIDWTEPALDDLEGVVVFVIEKTSDETARRLSEKVFEHVRVLETFPGIGPVFRPERQDVVREILCGTLRIFYWVIEDEKRVEILAVRHASRRDPDPKQLTDRTD